MLFYHANSTPLLCRYCLKFWFITTIILSASSHIFLSSASSAALSVETGSLPPSVRGNNLNDCAKKLKQQEGGWCEIRVNDEHPSISSVWPKKLDSRTHMITGPVSILIAWNSAAFDEQRKLFYFMGGGHADYGGNEVYEFDLNTGKWDRLTDPTPLDHLAVVVDYKKRKDKPWRRLCWTTSGKKIPAITHTYDGLLFSTSTNTLFLLGGGAPNGSCIEDEKDEYRDSLMVIGDGTKEGRGWFEFNPSRKERRNGLNPLTWRKVFSYEALEKARINQGYPVSAELENGKIVFGSKYRTALYDPLNPDEKKIIPFTNQADWGDGLKAFDKKRNILWSIHETSLLAFDAKRGNLLQTFKQVIPHGKSIAFDSDGKIISWNGTSDIFIFDPDERNPSWRLIDWGKSGPKVGDRRVYGKWVYLPQYDLFAGLSIHTTGVWIYKHPKRIAPITYEKDDLQLIVKKTRIGSKLFITPGVYGQGLYINKSMTVDLKGVSLRGVAQGKGIVNVDCDDCDVIIENLHADGLKANCLSGNCAGIKAEGKGFRLAVKNSRISNTVMGLLTDNRGGMVIFENSIIENSGLNDRSDTLGHGFYAGDIEKVVIKDSIIRRSFGDGHIFKSRAPDTEIENSVLAGLDGRHSRVIDFPCGGKPAIRNSVLQQGEQTDNIDLISIGTEPEHCGGSVRSSDVSINDSWILIDRDESSDERSGKYGFTRLLNWRAPIGRVDISNNRIVETTGHFKFDGEMKLPEMRNKNKMFYSRKDAGLDRNEIPQVSTQLQ